MTAKSKALAGLPPVEDVARAILEDAQPRPRVAVTRTCEECDGRGGWVEVGAMVMCTRCHGTGQVDD